MQSAPVGGSAPAQTIDQQKNGYQDLIPGVKTCVKIGLKLLGPITDITKQT